MGEVDIWNHYEMVSNLNFCLYTPSWYVKLDGFSVYTLESYIYAARLI